MQGLHITITVMNKRNTDWIENLTLYADTVAEAEVKVAQKVAWYTALGFPVTARIYNYETGEATSREAKP